MSQIDHAKTAADLLASIRPPAEDEEDQLEEQEEADEEGGEAADAGDDQPAGDDAGESDADEGEKPKKAKAEKKPRDVASEYFSRVRGNHKDLARELEAERAERLRIQQRVDDLQRRIDAGLVPQQATPKPEGNPFDKADQPVEHAQWEVERVQRNYAALKEQIDAGEQQKQQLEQQSARERAVSLYAKKVEKQLNQAFADPDIGPAFGGMFKAYNDTMVTHFIGQGIDEETAMREATLAHLRVAKAGEELGMTPAEAIYQQASRLGFDINYFAPQSQPAAKRQATAPAPAPNLDGARAASRRAPRSINSAPGGSGGRSRSIEALAGKRDKDLTKTEVSGLFRAMRERAGAY